jgi:hypothetical protein
VDVPTLAAGATIIGALVAAGIAAKRLPGQELSESVTTHHTILADMKLLNDVLVAECSRLRDREALLILQLEQSTTREHALEAELVACRARREVLENEGRRRGIGGL